MSCTATASASRQAQLLRAPVLTWPTSTPARKRPQTGSKACIVCASTHGRGSTLRAALVASMAPKWKARRPGEG